MKPRKKHLLRDRQALLDEIAALQAENLRLRLGEPPARSAPDSPEEEAAAHPGDFSRFPLLRTVDEKYEDTLFGEPPAVLEPAPAQETPPARTLAQITEHLRRYAAAHFGLYADRQLFAGFLGAMAASDFLLLRGGEAEHAPLAFCRAVAAAWGQSIEITPVQPDWNSPADLLGAPDPVTRSYRETELLRAVYEAGYAEGVNFAVLEGVTAAPAQCFSQLLPLLSLSHNPARKITLADSAWPGDPLLFQNGTLSWPGNLWTVGTLPPGAPVPARQLCAAAMEFRLPGKQKAKAFLAPLEDPDPLPARQLRDLFTRAHESFALPEDCLRQYAMTEQYLAEQMELSLGAQAQPQLRTFGSVCLACGLRPAEALDGFFYHAGLRRLEQASDTALKYGLPGLRRFMGETFGKRAMPLTMGYLEEMEGA